MEDNQDTASIQKLQQIPVFALRQLLIDLIHSKNLDEDVTNRYISIFNSTPRSFSQAIQNLHRESLVKLIKLCPEILDNDVNLLFEEYRYGSSPSFNIFVFSDADFHDLKLLRENTEKEFSEFNRPLESEEYPRLRRIFINDLIELDIQKVVIEGNYSFQSRLDYIDEEQNPTSVYQTRYGFFWINLEKKYVIVHAPEKKILQEIKRSIEQSINTPLTTLVIPKALKNSLPFLDRDALKSGKLHDPNKASANFRYISFVDESPYDKGYEDLEDRYPEVKDARYRTILDDEKETSLKIKCDRAAISLAGKIKASQFRSWCIEKLDILIDILNAFKNDVPQYIQTLDLHHAIPLEKFNTEQRKICIEIISKVLSLKSNSSMFESIAFSIASLKLAVIMEKYIRFQYDLSCEECAEEAEKMLLKCPTCDSFEFSFRSSKDSQMNLICNPINRSHMSFPINLKCRDEHESSLPIDSFFEDAEGIPSSDLLYAISEAINRHVPGFSFNQESEFFYFRGSQFFYFRYRTPEDKASKFQQINTYVEIKENKGSVTGLSSSEISN